MIFRKELQPYLPCIAIFATLTLTVLQLRIQGRVWWCDCGAYSLWAGDIWSSHNSQHLLDPYGFTHLLHGVVFYWVIACAAKKFPLKWKLVIAILTEASWEILENSQFIIDRYRESTMALGYNGDSIFNSLGDIVCCGIGFAVARRLGLLYSIALFVAVELILLFWIRDNLALNVLMLVHPLESIKAWQVVH